MDETSYEHAIFWDPLTQNPVVQLKEGILRRHYPLVLVRSQKRKRLVYENEYIRLEGLWRELNDHSCSLSLKLTNLHGQSVRITRLTFPAENGLDKFLKDHPSRDISFLRNGYQSWSTARSYHLKDRPIRPWLQLVSQVSSNMANLPSNIPGIFSSEMYALISDGLGSDTFLVGQGAAFRQFFYINFHLHRKGQGNSFFKLTYDFGRQLLKPGQTIILDDLYFSRGPLAVVQDEYFRKIQGDMGIKPPQSCPRGYGTWYYYYQHIHPDQILSNLRVLRDRGIPLSIFQIDDGYQKQVGDWLDLRESFQGRMEDLAEQIRRSGYTPGLWIAPFVANRQSKLAKIHPDYILKNEYGRRIIAGYNPTWEGNIFFGLDISNPRYEEYLRTVIRRIVHKWGFTYLKCDFLFAACLRSAVHYRFDLSRSDVLRYGMEVIRDEAGKDVLIEGCGMPLVPGVGSVDLMRIGPDTGPYWIKHTGKLLRTGAMMGVRNSIRNTLVRSGMHHRLWINDPDCLMLRKSRTKLNKAERKTHINALILSGGPLFISDDVTQFDDELWEQYGKICAMNEECSKGSCIPLDLMAQEIPELIYNSAGYLGIFNMSDRICTKRMDFSLIHSLGLSLPDFPGVLYDAWSKEPVALEAALNASSGTVLVVPSMKPHSSRLFTFSPALLPQDAYTR